MVPSNALEGASATFVGHNWGIFRAKHPLRSVLGPRMPFKQLYPIVRHALYSVGIVFVVEIILLIMMAAGVAYPYAYYLSEDEEVASLAATMWRTMDWTYILFTVGVQLNTILLASIPWTYLVGLSRTNAVMLET